MIKTSIKNIGISLILLCMVIVVLVAVDMAARIEVAADNTFIRVTVVDLNDKPVHNAEISIGGKSYFTDNKGLSPTIQLEQKNNSYDKEISEWYTANVSVKKDGYVPTVVINCVIYDNQTRRLTVKIYQSDSSDLPFVCYVESPPNSYIEQLVK